MPYPQLVTILIAFHAEQAQIAYRGHRISPSNSIVPGESKGCRRIAKWPWKWQGECRRNVHGDKQGGDDQRQQHVCEEKTGLPLAR